MPLQSCPSAELLSRYAVGQLDDESAAALDTHLSQCERCLTALDSVPSSGELFQKLRQLPTIDPATEPSTYRPRIPGYEIQELLGQGGMGRVYKAVHTRLGKVMAVKVMRGLRDRDSVSRFEREMKAVGRIDHPNVVRATDAGDSPDGPYLVMEYVPGNDLARLVRESGPLPAAVANQYIVQLARGLSAAHEVGIVHRDVKPSNAILTRDGTVKLLDLGLALLADQEPERLSGHEDTSDTPGVTKTGRAMGTRDYMAPEQAIDPRTADARADVYGLGATLWYLRTGQPPPRELPANRPDGVADWMKLLAPQPGQRLNNAAEVVDYLTQATIAIRRPGRRFTPAWIGLAIAASLLIGWIGWNRLPQNPPEAPSNPAPALRGTQVLAADEATAYRNEWLRYLNRDTAEQTNSQGQVLAFIPPGVVSLSPFCRVTITRPFELSTCEITNGQFEAFVEATSYRTFAESNPQGGFYLDWLAPAGQKFKSGPQYTWRTPGHRTTGKDRPITQVTWQDAQAYCAWLSAKDGVTYRLPTEAEWLWATYCGKAADNGILKSAIEDQGPVPWGWFRGTVGKELCPQPVGKTLPNTWGLFDMLGNVYEICEDEYDAYPNDHQTDYCCRGTQHQFHVIQGYCFFSISLDQAVSRGRLDSCNDSTGFRILRELPR